MRRLNEVSDSEIEDFLGKGWLTHDGMWFYHTYLDSGMDKANRVNREAIRSLAAVEMTRARKVLEVADEDLHRLAPRVVRGGAHLEHPLRGRSRPSSIITG